MPEELIFATLSMKSTVINILLILVLGITILPVAQVGSLLFKNQITEEKCGSEDGGSIKKADFGEPLLFNHVPGHSTCMQAFMDAAQYIHFAETLPPSHRGDIHSPPPNA